MIAVLSLALIPVVFLLGFVYLKDKIQPEPIGNLIKGVFYGVGSCFLVLAFAWLIPDFGMESVIGATLSAFFTAAIPEECAKFFMLWLLVRNMKEFDEPFDGIVYATCIGLGFAGFENIMYLIDNIDDVVSVGIMRGCFSVPGHFFFAVSMGYFYAMARFGSQRNRSHNYLMALVVPIALHGVFDAILMVNEATSLGILILVWIVFCLFMFKAGLKRIKSMRTPALPTMGTPVMPQGTPPPIPGNEMNGQQHTPQF